MNKTPFEEIERRTSKPLELVHSDLISPIEPQTPDGHKYAVVYIDEYSRLYTLRDKRALVKNDTW